VEQFNQYQKEKATKILIFQGMFKNMIAKSSPLHQSG
jgi:hypothetical protein